MNKLLNCNTKGKVYISNSNQSSTDRLSDIWEGLMSLVHMDVSLSFKTMGVVLLNIGYLSYYIAAHSSQSCQSFVRTPRTWEAMQRHVQLRTAGRSALAEPPDRWHTETASQRQTCESNAWLLPSGVSSHVTSLLTKATNELCDVEEMHILTSWKNPTVFTGSFFVLGFFSFLLFKQNKK